MDILVLALVAVLALILASRFIGRGQEKVLREYEVLEKRFRLARETYCSKWGKGIGEHYTLRGEYRGYPLSLYAHFQKIEGRRRQDWTSLVFETLFAEDLAIDLVFDNSQHEALFPSRVLQHRLEVGEGVTWLLNKGEGADPLLADPVRDRLLRFVRLPTCGVIRLNNGFLEYREAGWMKTEEMRHRFQEAVLLLGELSDAVSIFMAQKRREGS